jgi:hypothetical protein
MNKKRIVLLFVTLLLSAAAALWFHEKRLAEHPQNQLSSESETIATVTEETTPTELTDVPDEDLHVKEDHNTITVKNNITDKMITYKKGFINYIPEFKVTVNSIPLAQGEQKFLDIPDRKLKVTYSYDFVNGYKTGTRTVIFSIPENLVEVAIAFDWKNDWRVIIDGAEPLEIIE